MEIIRLLQPFSSKEVEIAIINSINYASLVPARYQFTVNPNAFIEIEISRALDPLNNIPTMLFGRLPCGYGNPQILYLLSISTIYGFDPITSDSHVNYLIENPELSIIKCYKF